MSNNDIKSNNFSSEQEKGFFFLIRSPILLCFKLKFLSTEKSHLETPLEENVNRIVPDEGTLEARTIEDAIAVLRYKSSTIYTFFTSC